MTGTGKTAADKLREKAQRLQERQHPQAPATAVAPVPEPTPHVPRSTAAVEAPLAKPVRSTLDLPPAVHRDLQAWLGEAAIRLGRARVTKQDALQALVRRLLVDEQLAKQILADLRTDQ